MSEQQRCGLCKWWVDGVIHAYQMCDYPEPNIKLPEAASIEWIAIGRDEGQSCPCFERKEGEDVRSTEDKG